MQPHVVPISPHLVSTQAAPYFPAGAPVAYTCRVCGTVLGAYQAACPLCGAPRGTIANANDPTSSTFLSVGFAPGAESQMPKGPRIGVGRAGKGLLVALVLGVVLVFIVLIVLVAVALNS